MIAKFGSIVTDARGKIGGHVFTRSISGNTVRTLVKPKDVKSVSQLKQRGSVGFISNFWTSLTPLEKQDWLNATPFFPSINSVGDVFFPSAHGLFVQLAGNQNRLFGFFSTVVDTNTQFVQIDSVSVEVQLAPNVLIRWSAIAPGVTSSFYAFVDATSVLPSMNPPFDNQFRQIQSGTFDTNAINDATTAYFNEFGDINQNGVIFFRVRQMSTNGRVGLPLQNYSDV